MNQWKDFLIKLFFSFFCIIDISCNFLWWSISSGKISLKFWIIIRYLVTDLQKKCLQNIPPNTCSKTNLFNYLFISMINWWLRVLFFCEQSRTTVRKSHNKLLFTHTVVKWWAVTRHSQLFIIRSCAHHSQPIPLTTGVHFSNVNYAIF